MFKHIAASAGLLVAMAGSAQAATVGFALTIGGSANAPSFTVENVSDTARISGGRVEIGLKRFNFDCVTSPAAPGGGTLSFTTPEVGGCFPGGGLRPDEIVFQASDFDPGETLSFSTDIDPDSYDAGVSGFGALMNGGRFEVTFVGAGLDAPLGVDFVGRTMSYRVTAPTATVGAVPLPAGAALVLT
ncbi:MAG: hypothetical protein ACP5EN_13030, partial [Rhodovulum sp.]